MAEPVVRVELTVSFLARLAAIESGSTEADMAAAYDLLLDKLRATVVPSLRRFPLVGRRYLDQPPQSAEANAQLAALPVGSADRLREYLHGDDLTVATPGHLVHLLSIRTTESCYSSFPSCGPVL